MAIAAVFVSVLALGFAIASFWWLNARTGRLVIATPHAYAFADLVRLRLPLAFMNTGAVSQIVTSLRVRVNDPTCDPLFWNRTCKLLQPTDADEAAFATGFSVPGRGTTEVIAEFVHERRWAPLGGLRHELRVEAQIHPSPAWTEVGRFDWWSPPVGASLQNYITYRNAPA